CRALVEERAVDSRDLVDRTRHANARERLGTPEVGHALETLCEQCSKLVGPVVTFDEPPHGRVGRDAPVVVLHEANAVAARSCLLLLSGAPTELSRVVLPQRGSTPCVRWQMERVGALAQCSLQLLELRETGLPFRFARPLVPARG